VTRHLPLPEDRRLPHPERLAPSHPHYRAIVAAHETALACGDDGYLDPVTGYFVFTAAAHWARGSCCRSGCRHCPFEPGPRPRLADLLDRQPRPGTE
jgi:hypothetical protein